MRLQILILDDGVLTSFMFESQDRPDYVSSLLEMFLGLPLEKNDFVILRIIKL